MFTLAVGGFSAAALHLSRTETLAKALGFMVVIMGFSFVVTALSMKPDLGAVLSGLVIPRLPEGAGAGMLVLGLIGTTVVPYNLFLGSGIARPEEGIRMMRFGLTVSILLGGLISMAILVVGSSVTGEFTFEAVSRSLASESGPGLALVFAIGLAAAGLSSSLTAPLASSVTAWSVSDDNPFWRRGGHGFGLVWAGVLLTGIVFGVIEFRPVPVIILAQALNGLILPLAAVALLFVVNDPRVMPRAHLNSGFRNFLMGLVVLVTMVLGLSSTGLAVAQSIGFEESLDGRIFPVTLTVSLVLTFFVFIKIGSYRRS